MLKFTAMRVTAVVAAVVVLVVEARAAVVSVPQDSGNALRTEDFQPQQIHLAIGDIKTILGDTSTLHCNFQCVLLGVQ
ncbi:hypothetical protein E2C01_025891 [Portunus trituberculatus]|uniref:Uncharacterized protein n=1 Tax=Portunus trituberculatus TaxID=210409 RepID=A0A5B7EHD2_PORTR|nr:hypothetical protein [Portunus trituberculatus]